MTSLRSPTTGTIFATMHVHYGKHQHDETVQRDLGHSHGPIGADEDNSPRRVLAVALGLTLTFMVIEIIAGLITGSLALLADAAHMASDSGGLALSFLIAAVARRPRDRRRTFGYRRAEVIGALVNAVAMMVVAVWITTEAVGRLQTQAMPIQGSLMAATAAIGLLVNIVVALMLSRARSNINVRGAMLHVIGDALGSVAALGAGIVIVTTGWYRADVIASTLIAAVMAYSAFRLLRECVHMLMQGTPVDIDCAAVEKTISATEGVAELHDLHIWAITSGAPVLTAHVSLVEGYDGAQVARAVGRRVMDAHSIHHVTIQPEVFAEIVQLRRGSEQN